MCAALCCALGAGAVDHARAQPLPSTEHETEHETRYHLQSITYAEVLARAGRGTLPQQALARARATYREAQHEVDGLVDNPTLSVAPGLRALPDTDRGFDLQVSLTQPIRTRDVAGARRAFAEAAAHTWGARGAAARRAQLARVTGLWFALWQAGEVGAVLHDSHTLALRFVERTRRAAAAGLSTHADVALAEVFAAELAIEQMDVAGQAYELGLSLSLALGEAVPVPLRAEGAPPQIDLSDADRLAQASERLSRAPEVRAQHAGLELARAQAQLARAENATSFALGVSLQRDAPDGFVALLSTSLQLPLFDQGTLARAAADTQVAQAAATRHWSQVQAAHALQRLGHEVQHQRATEGAIEAQLLPPLEAQRNDAERLLSLGEGTVLEVLRAHQAALAGRRRLLAARAARAAAEHALWLFLEGLEAS